jgi:hypothetical protein
MKVIFYGVFRHKLIEFGETEGSNGFLMGKNNAQSDPGDGFLLAMSLGHWEGGNSHGQSAMAVHPYIFSVLQRL